MLHCYPEFYKEFHCTGSDCKDNCCFGWDIVVDDDTLELYRNAEGPLGEALRNTLILDEDGDWILKMDHGRCPLLTENQLCSVQMALGHSALCHTCQKFPRLTQDYEVFTEYGLTLACPEAARLVLTQKGPWAWVQEGTPGSTEILEYDWDFLLELKEYRDILLKQLWDPKISPRQALARVVSLAQYFQKVIDGEAPNAWNPPALSPKSDCPRSLLEFHRNLEILTPEWAELLDLALDAENLEEIPACTDELQNLISYYLYRYWFQAVSDYDCQSRMELLAVNWLVVDRICRAYRQKHGKLDLSDRLRIYQLYAKEVEHDSDNQDALVEWLMDEAEGNVVEWI